VGVGGDDELDFALPRLAQPLWLHVEPVRITVNLDRGPRFPNDVEDLFDPTGEWWTSLYQAAQRVSPNLEPRLAHRLDDPARHLLLVHFVAGMNTRNDHIELFQDPVRVIE